MSTSTTSNDAVAGDGQRTLRLPANHGGGYPGIGEGATKEHRTVSRVTAILEAAAAADGGVRLATLAALLDAPKSSLHGLLKGLVATGYLREADGAYSIGPAIGLLVSPSKSDLPAVAHRILERMQHLTGETALLSHLVGDSVVYVDMVESGHVLKYSAPLRQRRPAYPTSAGKCFLAFMPLAKCCAYLDRHVPDLLERERVEKELDEVRSSRVSMNRGETVPDVCAVASPILADDRAVACVSIAGPAVRMQPRLEHVAQQLREEMASVVFGSPFNPGR